ncbi:MAG: protein kinase [Anaerolineae bacterium]|nr:protein kinase [Anaerolineae bacterium]
MSSETILNGRYALVAQQGSGGMSVIYKAIDRALGRTVAVKILRPSLTKDPSFLEKFRNEARSVANLSHPNIVTVHDVGSDGPTHYIVMEMVEGTDLKKIIRENKALPVERALDLAVQICAGIGYAHRSGLVHADVKPQNILVTSQDLVKVTDFGIAQALSDTQPQERAEVVWGSPHYFAPEQAKGEQPAATADVYATGIVLFEMLTGRLPYTGTNQQELAMAHIRDSIPSVTTFNPTVPDKLAKMVMKAMSKEPQNRFRDGDQFGNVLRDFRDKARMNTANPPRVVAPPPSPTDSKPLSQQPTEPRNVPPASRPPGIGIPPAPSPRGSNAEVTAKYSPAPQAPPPYDPRRPYQQSQPSVPNPITQAPQPFEQRYVPPPIQQGVQQQMPQQPNYPAPPQSPSDSGYYTAQYSRPITPDIDEDGGFDAVTLVLALIAIIAFLGLIPLWAFVIASR